MPKSKRAEWTSEDMEQALSSINRGVLSQHKASKRFNIPRTTLRDHLKTGSSIRKLGRPSTFTPEQEEDLCCRFVRLSYMGVPLTPQMLKFQAAVFCRKNNIATNLNSSNAAGGKKWLRLFLKRHPEIPVSRSKMPHSARKLNKEIVADHYDKVKILLEELMIENRPECIYNMGEKNCRISLHHQQKISPHKGSKRVHRISNENAESVTIVGCANAIGTVIPPMIIFNGKKLKRELRNNLPPGSFVKISPKTGLNHSNFVDFLFHLGKHKTTEHCLLIFDGAACQFDYSIVDEAERYGITLYCLPSNTTHQLQPLDNALYRSFEDHWDQEVLDFTAQNPEIKLNKNSFNVIFSKVWSKCMTNDTIIEGFRSTGLYPFDPDIIPEIAFAPLVRLDSQCPENMLPSTSASASQHDPYNFEPCLDNVPLFTFQPISASAEPATNYGLAAMLEAVKEANAPK